MKANDKENEQRRNLLLSLMNCRQDLQNMEQSILSKQVESDAEIAALEKTLNKQQKAIYTLEQNLAEFKERRL